MYIKLCKKSLNGEVVDHKCLTSLMSTLANARQLLNSDVNGCVREGPVTKMLNALFGDMYEWRGKFRETNIAYYLCDGKTIDYVTYSPKLAPRTYSAHTIEKVLQALEVKGAKVPSINRLGIITTETDTKKYPHAKFVAMNRTHISSMTFKTIADILAEYLGDTNTKFRPFEDVYFVLVVFCDILKGKIKIIETLTSAHEDE